MIRFNLTDKDPDGVDVFSIDWTKHLGQDTLSGVGTPPSETTEGTVVIDRVSNPVTVTTRFFVSGGAKGEVYRGRIHVTSTAGRELDAEVVGGVR